MKRILVKNIWWISFIGVFGLGLVIVVAYCFFNDNFTLNNVSLSDWLGYFGACGTIGGFLYLILDKILGEKEINHLKWQSQIPFVTVTSPCDPTANYCDINILTNSATYTGRGNEYFSISNIGRINAYDIKIEFFKKEYSSKTIFHRHYIAYLPPITTIVANGELYYSNKESIYSDFSISPETKEISNSKFEICGCIDDCTSPNLSTEEKCFFVRIEYFSSFSKKHRYKILSTLQINAVCSQEDGMPCVRIKGITFLDYSYTDN